MTLREFGISNYMISNTPENKSKCIIRLINRDTNNDLYQVEVGEGEMLKIGREFNHPGYAPNVQMLLLPDSSVCRQHAVVRSKDTGWVIADNKSKNGTFINDIKLSPGVDYMLRDGDSVRIANNLIKVEIKDSTLEEFFKDGFSEDLHLDILTTLATKNKKDIPNDFTVFKANLHISNEIDYITEFVERQLKLLCWDWIKIVREFDGQVAKIEFPGYQMTSVWIADCRYDKGVMGVTLALKCAQHLQKISRKEYEKIGLSKNLTLEMNIATYEPFEREPLKDPSEVIFKGVKKPKVVSSDIIVDYLTCQLTKQNFRYEQLKADDDGVRDPNLPFRLVERL